MTEENLHKQICQYLKLQYPKIIFNTDLSGVKLTFGQAKKAKNLRSGNGFPDIVIYEKSDCGNFNALFLEVKKQTPYKKNGNLKKNDHIFNQQIMHEKLVKRGYFACFVWEFNQSKIIIDNYLKSGKI